MLLGGRDARKILFALWVGTFVIALAMIAAARQPAKALPSYARQTGQPCGTCHTDFAGLTPYGRLFQDPRLHGGWRRLPQHAVSGL